MQKEIIIQPIITAFRNITQSPLQYLRFNLLFFAIIFLINYLAAVISMMITYDRDLQEIILVIFKIPVTAYFIGGFTYFYLSLVRGVTVRTAKIYRGYRWYYQILVYELLVYFLYLLLVRPIVDFFDFPLVIQIRLIFGIIAYLYLFIRASFFLAIVVDTRVSFMKTLAESFVLTRDSFFETGLFIALGLAVIMSGILAAGIGIIFTMAVATQGYVLLYEILRKKRLS